jgi:hypothetical protein
VYSHPRESQTLRYHLWVGPKPPGRCAGWSAAYQLAAQLPEAFIVESVGSTYHFNPNPLNRLEKV